MNTFETIKTKGNLLDVNYDEIIILSVYFLLKIVIKEI